MIKFCIISKMNKSYSIETIDKTNLTNQTKFRLDEISTASGGVSIISITSIAGAPVGIASAGLSLFFL